MGVIKASEKLFSGSIWYKSFLQRLKIILYLWRQEFLSRFLRCSVCISFNFLCQGKFCLAARIDESLTLMSFILLRSVNTNTSNSLVLFNMKRSSYHWNATSLKTGISDKVYVMRRLHQVKSFCKGKFFLAACVDESLTLMNFIRLRSVIANTKNFSGSI